MPQPNLPPVDSWQVLNLELITFPENSAAALDQNWWSDLTGADCESTRKRFERVDIGEFNGHALKLAIDPLRIRWSIGPVVAVTAERGESSPFIGPFTDVRDSFCNLIEQWMPNAPPSRRLAFSGKLLQSTPTREDSYQLLGRYLDVPLDPASTDFQYRINRKRPSATGVPGLDVNRLTTWSSIRMEISMQVSASESGASQIVPVTELNGAFLQLDINTIQEFQGLLPQASLNAIWHELVDFGSEIAASGDIP